MSTVLVLGASGFLGARLAHALEQAGFDVIRGVHAAGAWPGARTIPVDYLRDHTPAVWQPRLGGVDVVVNAVGILRESVAGSFEALHVAAPAALFRACAEVGVSKIVHISALGADADAQSRYHVTKRQGDDVLASLDLPWIIVQPSLVFGTGGTSASLFARLAALPLIPVPGRGDQCVQPIHVDDLCEAVVRLVATAAHDRQRIAAVGPHAITLRDFLGALRRALGLGAPHFLRVPMMLVRAAAALGDRTRAALLDSETLGMLLRGNVAPADRIAAVLGRPPRGVEALVAAGEHRAMANEARLAWLLPLLRLSIGIVWIATGIVSLGVYPVADSYAMLARVGLTGAAATVALYGAAALDLAFGVGIFALRDRRWLWRAQIVLIAAYSVIIAFALPEYWLHPFGPLLKNLPMLVGIVVLHELEEREA